MALSEGHRAFLFKVLGKSGTIEIRPGTSQWRISPDFLIILEDYMQKVGPFDGITKAIEFACSDMNFEERQLVTSFMMEYCETNYSNVKMPEVKDTDLKDTTELIDYLMNEEERKAK